MTREEALENTTTVDITTVDTTTKRTEKRTETHECDYISRQDAINAIENTDCELSTDAWNELTDAIMSLPPAQRKGKWIQKNKNLAPFNTIWWFECSECGEHAYNDILSEYCPCCGADMRQDDVRFVDSMTWKGEEDE